MSDHDRDALIRMIAFGHVRRLAEVHDHLTATELKPGFIFNGERIPLINPQRGIFKPQQMRFLLSIKTVFPRGLDAFDLVDGVWVAEPRCAVPVAIALRESLIALHGARLAGEGQQTKMEMVYQYLTGPRFKHRIEAIVEKFSEMRSDLDKERKTMTRLWAKREEQLLGVITSTAGMYGDLQGIAGKTMQEIDGLELPMLDGPPEPPVAPS
jgi:hypothetical protein